MGYLFVHFTNDQQDNEQVYFSVSDDGLHWCDLNRGKPVLRSSIGDRGVRDPFMVCHPVTGRYYLMATDLCIYNRKSWASAQYEGSRALMVWESDDLITWSEQRACTIAVDGAGCLWAPEAIFDEEAGQFLVFWASMVQLDGDALPKQRIYAAYTQDFRIFSKPFLYAEARNHLIDMNIVRDADWYYRFVKDETTKIIRVERTQTLNGQNVKPIASQTLDQLFGVEGPECYRLPDGRWCLLVDQFSKGLGYLPLVTNDLSSGQFEILPPQSYDLGRIKKRHGGVIAIPSEAMKRLIHTYGCDEKERA